MILPLSVNPHFGCELLPSVCEHDVSTHYNNPEPQDRILLRALDIDIFPDPSLLSPRSAFQRVVDGPYPGDESGEFWTSTVVEGPASGLFWFMETTSRGRSFKSARIEFTY